VATVDPKVFAAIWARRDISIERIASALGVSHQAVSQRARRLRLPPRTGNQESRKKIPDGPFRRMWEAGVSTSEIAKAAGYADTSGVTRRRELMGLPARQRVDGVKGGYPRTMSLAEFQEEEIARLMNNSVRAARRP